jgi:hypothetical protein
MKNNEQSRQTLMIFSFLSHLFSLIFLAPIFISQHFDYFLTSKKTLHYHKCNKTMFVKLLSNLETKKIRAGQYEFNFFNAFFLMLDKISMFNFIVLNKQILSSTT